MSVQQAAIDKLYNSMIALEQKIIEAKRQKDSFIARAKTAKTSVQVNDMLSSMTGTNSMEVFERMKAKVETLEAKAEVAGELAASTSGTSVSLEERFKELEGNSAVDDELEQLRRQLPGTQAAPKPIPQLPQPMSAIDEEYERLKKELGKR
jgi:phage shock protein A